MKKPSPTGAPFALHCPPPQVGRATGCWRPPFPFLRSDTFNIVVIVSSIPFLGHHQHHRHHHHHVLDGWVICYINRSHLSKSHTLGFKTIIGTPCCSYLPYCHHHHRHYHLPLPPSYLKSPHSPPSHHQDPGYSHLHTQHIMEQYVWSKAQKVETS